MVITLVKVINYCMTAANIPLNFIFKKTNNKETNIDNKNWGIEVASQFVVHVFSHMDGLN